MEFSSENVRDNARQATTEDLLDRVTVYRAGMEPEALAIIERELRSRGLAAADIADHAQEREPTIIELPDGTSVQCSFCYRPAIEQFWGWHRLWKKVPVFPRLFAYCAEHQPE